ncbi:hypothetical protein OF83DRAFT_1023694, partial [Amylostereum chailletii]
LAHFVRGDVDLLFATEVAGMGCDISNLECVVQFMAPGSLSIWLQCAGRAGRQMFQEKGKNTREADEEVEYMKTIDPGLRAWIK